MIIYFAFQFKLIQVPVPGRGWDPLILKSLYNAHTWKIILEKKKILDKMMEDKAH